jgi:hypothetical protein
MECEGRWLGLGFGFFCPSKAHPPPMQIPYLSSVVCPSGFCHGLETPCSRPLAQIFCSVPVVRVPRARGPQTLTEGVLWGLKLS